MLNENASRNEGMPLARPAGDDPLSKVLEALLVNPDEAGFDPIWLEAQREVQELALRPAKRLRPRLLMLGYTAGGGKLPAPQGLWHFAAGLEVAHTFLLVHDDIADRSELRRGGPTLHRALARHGAGDDLAVVAGDHLFARGIELLFTANLPGASRAALHFLGVCRHTAAGQYLDLVLSRRPLSEVSPFEALRVADLKTARYSFAAPLVCGAMLAGASAELTSGLSRVGRLAGLAFQLQDDLLGIFGDPNATGKPGDADLAEGKRTYPLLMAYQRADAEEKAVLEQVGSVQAPEWTAEVRKIIRAHGGEASTQRVIDRTTRAALRALAGLGIPEAQVEPIHSLLRRLERRDG